MTIAEMVRMRKAGFTYEEIGAKADVPWSTIRSRCRSLGVVPEAKVIRSRNKRPKHNYPRWLIYEMYWVCRLSTFDIAYELDIPSNTVQSMMIRLQIPRRTKKEAWAVLKVSRPDFHPPYNSPEQQRKAGMAGVEARKRKAKRNAEEREQRRRKREQLA